MAEKWASNPEGTKGNPNEVLNKRPVEPNHACIVADSKGVERHEYPTNENGYVTDVISKIDRDSLHSSCRFPSAQCSVGKDGDEGGHMIATSLGGIGERLNVFPQNWKLNRGKGSKWRKMENRWLKLAQEGKEVRVTMHFKYGDPQNPGRPTEIEVVEIVDGKIEKYPYKNEAPQ